MKYEVRLNGKRVAEFKKLSTVSEWLVNNWIPGLVVTVVKVLNGQIIDNYI